MILLTKYKKIINLSFFRFIIVGVLATIIHYLAYFIFLSFVKANVAFSLGYLMSFIFNYLSSAFFTFRSDISLSKLFGFGFSHFVNYILQISCLNLMFHLGMSKTIAPIITFVLIFPINFTLVRFVFRAKKNLS